VAGDVPSGIELRPGGWAIDWGGSVGNHGSLHQL
jgi:hypothetical protein